MGAQALPEPDDRRAEIIRVALQTFGERGYRGTSLAAVAARVGMTAPGLLHHFPSKTALLVEVLRERQRQMAQPDSGPRLAFADAVRRVVALMQRDPGIPQSMMVLSADSVTEDHPARPFFEERYTGLRASLVATIAEQYGDPLPNGLTAASAAALLVAVLDGARLQWLLQPDEFDLAARVDDFLALLDLPAGT